MTINQEDSQKTSGKPTSIYIFINYKINYMGLNKVVPSSSTTLKETRITALEEVKMLIEANVLR